MSDYQIPTPVAEENPEAGLPKKIKWGLWVFLAGILGLVVSFVSQYFPENEFPYWIGSGAFVVTLAALASYIAVFQKSGRTFAVWSMMIFSIASPILIFIAFIGFSISGK